MNYVSLYRKWRPQAFEDLIGQDHITRTLKNALKSGRISHAYLFCGPRGTGKTTAAKILSKALNCEEGTSPRPCNQCNVCQGINKGNIMDVQEIDAASNRGIDEIRDLREKVRFGATQARFKVYIIDEVHMLTPEAFNALLKTLEEPPEKVIFILATTEPHKLPQTILSRCQRFDYHRIGVPIMVEGLSRIAAREGVKVEEEALKIIARNSQGGMRDGIGLLEQVMSFCEDSVSLEEAKQVLGLEEEDIFINMGEAVLKNDLVSGLNLVREVADRGRDLSQFVRDLTGYFRSLIVLKIQGEEPAELDIPWVSLERMKKQGKQFSQEGLLFINEVLTGCVADLRGSSQPRFVLETAVFQICHLDFKLSLQNIERKIEKLEESHLEIKEGRVHSLLPPEPELRPETENSSITGKAEQSGQPDPLDQPDHPGQSGQPDYADYVEQPGQTDHAYHPDQTDYAYQPDKSGQEDHPQAEHEDHPGQTEQSDYPGQTEHPDYPDQPEQAEQAGSPSRAEEARQDRTEDTAAAPSLSGHENKADRADRTDQADTEGLSLKDIKGLWKDVLKQLQKNDVVTYSWLEQGGPSSYEGGLLTIELANSLAQDKLEKEKPKKAIEEVLWRITGSKVRIKFVLRDNAKAKETEAAGTGPNASDDSNYDRSYDITRDNNLENNLDDNYGDSLDNNLENSIDNSIDNNLDTISLENSLENNFENRCAGSFDNNNMDSHNDDFVTQVLRMFKGKLVDSEEIKKGGFFGV